MGTSPNRSFGGVAISLHGLASSTAPTVLIILVIYIVPRANEPVRCNSGS